ncbi:MAG: hypothetical protein P5702_21055 [Limnospira sp. PMC 1291.21]|uniref:DUF2281 domain-containing protein n=3 Tax=Limnospira TaxID=2596745 RepID=A0A9P1KCC8_9CYAN|nr:MULTISPECIES: hypothetical protein [Limnospira]EKD10773.1 hypothetical protein SPLC1_S061470 [Arthrospira platensis C1]MDC0840007.1 hypothetical protein [Limnoraphis robusta]MDY7055308.1 hypothetical protein [Limnospira fusiformis LS22]EDZ95026.1 hypothetical protein AmaxDRAFT_2204 [Limnospira maxima CS-328]MDT9177460.1 hypothetical protein [Limnospira sp. PMC 1238.20]
MNSDIRQEIIDLARELPDDVLPDVLTFLRFINDRKKPIIPDNDTANNQAESSRAIAAYKAIADKYKNALRELAK